MFIKILIPFLLIVAPVFGQLPTKVIEAVNSSNESIIIQGLRSNYMAGEKLSISIEVLEVKTGKSTQISIPVYVELIESGEGKLLKRFVLKLESGKAKLEYRLPISFKTSNYQIRAYTNWMKNFPESSFGKASFLVFGQNYKEEMQQVSLEPVLDTVLMFPEGGNLISNLKSKVVIKALDNFGRPFETNFSIKNKKNETIIESKTEANGLCYFEFQPKDSDKYYVNTLTRNFEIPEIKSSGVSLLIDNISNKEKVKVIIQNSADFVSKDSLYFVIVNKSEIVQFLNFENIKPHLLFSFEKQKLPAGTLQAYLFNEKGEIISSRFFENKHKERPNLDLNLSLIQSLPERLSPKTIKYYPERGLSIKGRIQKISGKELKKEEKFTVILSNLNSDTSSANSETIFVESKGNFIINDLDFYGKKQATFVSPYAIIEVDTTIEIPSILAEKKPVNWKLVSSELEMERRKEALINAQIEESRRNSISLDEVTIKAKKFIDPFNKFGNAVPQTVLDDKDVAVFPQMTDMIAYLLKYKCSGQRAKVILNGNTELRKEDNLLDFFIGNIEKVEIFKDAEAALFNCNCAINVVMYGSRSFLKENKTLIVEGYYSNDF